MSRRLRAGIPTAALAVTALAGCTSTAPVTNAGDAEGPIAVRAAEARLPYQSERR